MTVEAKTLKGLGAFLQNDLCPACRILHDAPSENQIDIAFCYGVALVYVRGADATTHDLCAKHGGMVRALVRESKHPSGWDF
jgi:hypothetical protein